MASRVGVSLLALLFLSLTRCSSSSDDPTGPAQDGTGERWDTVSVPQTIPPTEPGLVEVGPPGLVIAIGESSQLRAILRDSEGAELATPAWTFTSRAPDVVAVDGSGNVVAKGEGEAEILVTDQHHGQASVWVRVSTTPASGATGFACSPSVLVGRVGTPIAIPIVVSGAHGEAVDAAGVRLVNAEGVDLPLDANHAFVPSTAGAVHVRAVSADGRRLEGSCIVAAVPEAGSVKTSSVHTDLHPNAPPGACASPTMESICWGTRLPTRFTRPGLADELRVSVLRTFECPGVLATWHELTQRSPYTLDMIGTGVVSVGADGLVHSEAPGLTKLRPAVDGKPCTVVWTHVDMDLNGDWGTTCMDGRFEGSLHLDGAMAIVDTRVFNETTDAAGAVSGGFANPSRGTGCFRQNGTAPSECTDTAEGEAVGGSNDGFGPCSASLACYAVAVNHCMSSNMKSDSYNRILGRDKFSIGECTFTRGAGPVACVTGGASSIVFTYNGSTLAAPPLYPWAGRDTAGTGVGVGSSWSNKPNFATAYLYANGPVIAQSGMTYTYASDGSGNLTAPIFSMSAGTSTKEDCGSSITFTKITDESDGSTTLEGFGSGTMNCAGPGPSTQISVTFKVNSQAAEYACCRQHMGVKEDGACGPNGEVPCWDGTFSDVCKC